MTSLAALSVLSRLERSGGTEPFTFDDARRNGAVSASTLSGLRRDGYIRRISPRRQGGSDHSRTLWVITPKGEAKAQSGGSP
jgi:hypothetical protein